jgi:hypothetical protein
MNPPHIVMLIADTASSRTFYMRHLRRNDSIVSYLAGLRIHDHAHLGAERPYIITWFVTPLIFRVVNPRNRYTAATVTDLVNSSHLVYFFVSPVFNLLKRRTDLPSAH